VVSLTLVPKPQALISCSLDGSARVWAANGLPIGVLVAPPRNEVLERAAAAAAAEAAAAGAAPPKKKFVPKGLTKAECPWQFAPNMAPRVEASSAAAAALVDEIAAEFERAAAAAAAARAEADALAKKGAMASRLKLLAHAAPGGGGGGGGFASKWPSLVKAGAGVDLAGDAAREAGAAAAAARPAAIVAAAGAAAEAALESAAEPVCGELNPGTRLVHPARVDPAPRRASVALQSVRTPHPPPLPHTHTPTG